MSKLKNRSKRHFNKNCYIFIAILIVFIAVLGMVFLIAAHGKKQKKVPDTEAVVTQTMDSDSESVLGFEESTAEETEMQLIEEKSPEQLLEERIDAKMAQMTLEERVLQMFMITPEALTGYGTVTAAGDVTYQSLQKYPVGGIILFAQNVIDPDQLGTMNGNLQNYSEEITGLPMFISVDEEGGKVARIAKNSNFSVETFSDMRSIGDSGDTAKAYEVGNTIGAYLNQYGFNLDFAPDADVLTNPDNQVIGTRSFGTDPYVVSEMTQSVVKGLEDNQVYACLKHFPGHGATSGDTHAGYAYTDKTLDELMQSELVPFSNGIQNGVHFIMVSHIAAPQVTGDNLPASLSPYMIQNVLREQMGYDGIVITDAMNMGAISDSYGSADAAVRAVNAGADIVLMPKDFVSAYQGVLNAVENGTISTDRIDESVRRILRLKMQP